MCVSAAVMSMLTSCINTHGTTLFPAPRIQMPSGLRKPFLDLAGGRMQFHKACMTFHPKPPACPPWLNRWAEKLCRGAPRSLEGLCFCMAQGQVRRMANSKPPGQRLERVIEHLLCVPGTVLRAGDAKSNKAGSVPCRALCVSGETADERPEPIVMLG